MQPTAEVRTVLRRVAKGRPPAAEKLPPAPFTRLHHEVIGFAQAIWTEMEPIEREVEAILASIRRVVSARWAGASAELYGSRATGLALTSSDMDVVLLDLSCPPSGVGAALRSLMDDLLRDQGAAATGGGGAAKGAAPASTWVKSHKLVLSARIPVLKLQSTSGVPVDITIASSSHHTGLAARDLVLKFCQQAPQIVPLVLVLKTFLRSLNLNDPFTGGISSYCIVVLLHKYWFETERAQWFSTHDGGQLLFNFLYAFVLRFEKQLTHVDDPLTPPVIAEDGVTILQPSENIMQSCYQISRLCLMFRKAMAAITPENPEVGAWETFDGSLLDRLFAVAGQTISTQTEPPPKKLDAASTTTQADPPPPKAPTKSGGSQTEPVPLSRGPSVDEGLGETKRAAAVASSSTTTAAAATQAGEAEGKAAAASPDADAATETTKPPVAAAAAAAAADDDKGVPKAAAVEEAAEATDVTKAEAAAATAEAAAATAEVAAATAEAAAAPTDEGGAD